MRWGTVRGRGYGRIYIWGYAKKKVEKMRGASGADESFIYIYYRGARDGCGRWVGVRVEGELGRFPDGDLLW